MKRKQICIESLHGQSKRLQSEKEEFIISTVSSFIKANIPLEKLDDPDLRKWMDKYIPGK